MNIETRTRPRQPPPTLARLPPLTALRAFVATARHLNFSGAADELHVTSAAVGQQIRLLEEHLGHLLFVRHRGTLRLTAAGRALMPGLVSAFDILLETLSALSEDAARVPVRVAVSPSFAAKWLVQRLAGLQATGLRLDILLETSPRNAGLFNDEADCFVGYGAGSMAGSMAGSVAGLMVDRLFDEAVAPVCSPEFAGHYGLFGDPAALARAPLLHERGPSADASCPDWGDILRAWGLPARLADSGTILDQPSLVIDAAAAGQGVGLAKLRLAADDLAAGRLVIPFGEPHPVEFSYFFASTSLKSKSAPVRQFRQWLLAEARSARGFADAFPPRGAARLPDLSLKPAKGSPYPCPSSTARSAEAACAYPHSPSAP